MENATMLDFESWEQKKIKIFAMFRELTEGIEMDSDINAKKKAQDINANIKYGAGKNRMGELGAAGGAKDPHGTMISAKEFTVQLERLDKELEKFWAKDDKVACIRIAIQCAKLLNDTSTPMFYPQKFILLTDILDSFGELVYGRMKMLT